MSIDSSSHTRQEGSAQERGTRCPNASRRKFIGSLGAGAIAGLAGCSGGTSDSGGQTDTPEPGGQQTTAKTKKTKIKMVTFPLDVDGLVAQHIKNSGIWEEEMSNAGYDATMQLTFKGLPQFLSGKADIAGLGGIEAARLGLERKLNLVNFSVRSWMYLGMMVKVGSKWDPENTGSVEATIDKIAREGGKIGIGGWAAGNVPVDQIILAKGFGKQMSQKGGDFTVVTAKFPSLPQLLTDGEIALATSSPTHGAANELVNDEVKPLYWGHDKLNSLGFGKPPLGGLGTRKEFFDQEREACEACLRAWQRGMDWFFNEGLEEVPPNKDKRDRLGATTKEGAKYAIRWNYHNEGVKYRSRLRPRPQNIALTDQKVNNVTKFLKATENAGMLKSGWEEYFEMIKI